MDTEANVATESEPVTNGVETPEMAEADNVAMESEPVTNGEEKVSRNRRGYTVLARNRGEPSWEIILSGATKGECDRFIGQCRHLIEKSYDMVQVTKTRVVSELAL